MKEEQWQFRDEGPSLGALGRQEESDRLQRRGLTGDLRDSVWLRINSCFRERENPCFY